MACGVYYAQLVARHDAYLGRGGIPGDDGETWLGVAGTVDSRKPLWADLYPNVEFLLMEFKRELVSLGVDWKPLIKDIENVKLGFARKGIALKPARFGPSRDVPPTNWAANAVGELRKLGVLNGYPDGRFRG
jgi:hypothetical protein